MKDFNSHTSCLFHFTKKQDNLISILKDGLKLSYCREEFFPNLNVIIPMISFCDIPLSLCTEHREKYGRYAIGFRKDAFDKLGNEVEIGPILYYRKEQNNIVDLCLKLFSERNQSLGWFKKFEMIRNNKVQINYDECEWRILKNTEDESKEKDWFWELNIYYDWLKDRDNKFLPNGTIPFDIEDVKYILVYQDGNIKSTIKRILSLKQFCGKPLSDENKELIISKIMSFDQLRLDI